MAFYTYLGQLVFPMIALGFVTNIFQRGAASMGRLNYILNAQPNIRNSAVLEEETLRPGSPWEWPPYRTLYR